MNSLRVGFLGAGTVARLHAAAIEQTPGVDLVGIADPNWSQAAELAAVHGVMGVADGESLIERADIDAIFILTPTAAHADLAHRCLDAGKHVLIEKPVAENPEAIKKIVAHAERVGRLAIPGHNYLYLPECTRLLRLIRAGKLGTVRALFITYAIAHPEDLAAHYGGVMDEILIHHAYLALAVLGAPDSVQGGRAATGWDNLATDDQAWMTWEYESGAIAQLFGTFAVDDLSSDPVNFGIKVLGTDGSAAINWRAVSTSDGGPFRVGMPLYEETYLHECAAFRDAVRGESAPLSTLDDAARIARMIDELGT